MRRTIAVAAGLLALVALAMLPSTASAQYIPPPTLPTTTTTTPSTTSTSVLPDEETTTTTTEAPTTTAEPTTTAAPTTQAAVVAGDVIRRPLPRTGNDIGGTALFGGALTVLGIALALGARKRRNSFDGA